MKLSSIFDPDSIPAILGAVCASIVDSDYQMVWVDTEIGINGTVYSRVNIDAEFPEDMIRRVLRLGPGTVEVNGLSIRATGFEILDEPLEPAARYPSGLTVAFIEDPPSLPPKIDTLSAARRSVITKHMKKRSKR